MSKTQTFPKLKNVCYCLVLHLLRIGLESFAIVHSPCARMIWTSTTCLILRRCRESISSSSTTNLSVCCASKPGGCSLRRCHCSNFHQFIRFPLLRRPILVSIPLQVILMSKRLKQVSLFFDAAHSMSSGVVDFYVWFSPGFLMQ